jgi:hypothetical protein
MARLAMERRDEMEHLNIKEMERGFDVLRDRIRIVPHEILSTHAGTDNNIG